MGPSFACRALFILFTLFLGGCSMGGMRWSSPATKGHGRIGIVPGWVDDDGRSPAGPSLAVEYRRGVSEHVDLGGRVFTLGAALDTRVLLARTDDVDVTVGAGVRARPTAPGCASASCDGYEVALEPPLRIGLHVSRTSQVALGVTPSLGWSRETRGAFHKQGLSFTPEATLAVDLGFGDGFHLVPEIGAATFVGSDSFVVTDDTVRLRGAVGFYF